MILKIYKTVEFKLDNILKNLAYISKCIYNYQGDSTKAKF